MQDAIQRLGQLTDIMKSLYDLESNVPSFEIASHARILVSNTNNCARREDLRHQLEF